MIRTALTIAVMMTLTVPATAQSYISCQAIDADAVTPGRIYGQQQAGAVFEALSMSADGMEEIGVVVASATVIVIIRKSGFLCNGPPVDKETWDRAVRAVLGNEV